MAELCFCIRVFFPPSLPLHFVSCGSLEWIQSLSPFFSTSNQTEFLMIWQCFHHYLLLYHKTLCEELPWTTATFHLPFHFCSQKKSVKLKACHALGTDFSSTPSIDVSALCAVTTNDKHFTFVLYFKNFIFSYSHSSELLPLGLCSSFIGNSRQK